jgi:hypothetical protein
MYFQNYTPPQTHLAPAETNPAFGAYELQGLGSNSGQPSLLGSVANVAAWASPFMFGYYGYSKNGSAADAAMWGIGSLVLQLPASLLMALVGAVVGGEPGAQLGTMVFPAVGAYYAFGKKD